MNRNDKILIAIGVVLLASIVYFGFFLGENTGNVVLDEGFEKYVATVCYKGNYCQDYNVWCDNGSVIDMQMIEGTDYERSAEWMNSRSEEEKTLCYGRG